MASTTVSAPLSVWSREGRGERNQSSNQPQLWSNKYKWTQQSNSIFPLDACRIFCCQILNLRISSGWQTPQQSSLFSTRSGIICQSNFSKTRIWRCSYLFGTHVERDCWKWWMEKRDTKNPWTIWKIFHHPVSSNERAQKRFSDRLKRKPH